jgi:peroxiredoxin Q/BCP
MASIRRIATLAGGLLLGLTSAQAITLEVGNPAPDFTAASTDNTTFHLKEAIGTQPIVLYFYPKDNTPGCTAEACSLRDNFAAFRELNAAVYGISYDSVATHQAFAAKHKLPFPLLADKNKTIAKAYGANGLMFARRMTFVIDKAGKIAWMDRSVNPSTHAAELQKVLTDLNGKSR